MINILMSKIIQPFAPYIIGGAACIIALLYWQNSSLSSRYDKLLTDSATKIERAQANADKLEGAVSDQKIQIEQLLIEKGENKAKSDFRNIQLAELASTLNEERLKNESYRNRWSKVSRRKPELLSRIINRATNKRVQFFAATTCRANCDPEGNNQDSGSTTTQARPDSGQ